MSGNLIIIKLLILDNLNASFNEKICAGNKYFQNHVDYVLKTSIYLEMKNGEAWNLAVKKFFILSQ